jgi:hypothetical protein
MHAVNLFFHPQQLRMEFTRCSGRAGLLTGGSYEREELIAMSLGSFRQCNFRRFGRADESILHASESPIRDSRLIESDDSQEPRF